MMHVGRDAPASFDRSSTLAIVVSTLENLMQDWDVEEAIEPDTRVVADLDFESIDLIQMVAALEVAFRMQRGSLVDLLVKDGRYVDDLSVQQIADGIAVRTAQTGRK